MRFELMASAMSRRRHNQLDHGPRNAAQYLCLNTMLVLMRTIVVQYPILRFPSNIWMHLEINSFSRDH